MQLQDKSFQVYSNGSSSKKSVPNYWKEAEQINGRLAMMGLVRTRSQLRIYWMDSTRHLLKNETQHTIHNSKKEQTHDTRSRKI